MSLTIEWVLSSGLDFSWFWHSELNAFSRSWHESSEMLSVGLWSPSPALQVWSTGCPGGDQGEEGEILPAATGHLDPRVPLCHCFLCKLCLRAAEVSELYHRWLPTPDLKFVLTSSFRYPSFQICFLWCIYYFQILTSKILTARNMTPFCNFFLSLTSCSVGNPANSTSRETG